MIEEPTIEWLKKQCVNEDALDNAYHGQDCGSMYVSWSNVELHLKFLKVQEKKKINQLKDLIGSQIKYTNDSNYCDVNNAFNNCLDLIEKVFLK